MTHKGKKVLDLKKRAKKSLCAQFGWKNTDEKIALLSIADGKTASFLAEGLSLLGFRCVFLRTESKKTHKKKGKKSKEVLVLGNAEIITKMPSEKTLAGFDCCVWDGESDCDIVKAVSAGVVPVVPENTVLAESFEQFNPLEFTGNAFLFREANPFLVFAAVVAFIENSKFPEDRKTLLKNVLRTF